MNFNIYFLVVFIYAVTANDDSKKTCGENLCIAKCCPENQSVYKNKTCVYFESASFFSDVYVYDSNFQNTSKTISEVFKFVNKSDLGVGKGFKILNEHDQHFGAYMIDTGVLYLEKPNAFHRWTERSNNQFCIDYEITGDGENFTARPAFWVVLSDLTPDSMEEQRGWNTFVTAALFVSCFFLSVTLAVYCILPELRNLCGMILMAYVFTLLVGFLLHGTTRILTVDNVALFVDDCLHLTLAIYASLLSSFFWMNVMSFDIWWTFRGYAKARPIHRRGETFKFCMYGLYAWGVPGAMTIAMYFLYYADLRHIPWFIKPNIDCFLSDGEKLLYLYVPMLILILCNWMFFAMTAYNVWRLSRNTGVLERAAAGRPADHRSQRSRLMVYVKLSVIMGVSWVLEVVSSFSPALKVWHLTDAYHALIGFIIFLIFICKKKIFKKSVKRIRESNSFRKTKSRYTNGTSTNTSDIEFSTQETPLQVCGSPDGLYCKKYQL